MLNLHCILKEEAEKAVVPNKFFVVVLQPPFAPRKDVFTRNELDLQFLALIS
ncbi:hypothetical protein Q669_01375 [Labrenzia sp. C1B10]|nr:hypothetical protein Q669_01375 [Labrenzia sp. C1B10]ERS05654.1 hypothetical protein Q675_04550 [Labrenzia sp. C1B70]